MVGRFLGFGTRQTHKFEPLHDIMLLLLATHEHCEWMLLESVPSDEASKEDDALLKPPAP